MMTERALKLVVGSVKFLAAFALVFIFLTPVAAQQKAQGQRPDLVDPKDPDASPLRPYNSIEEEMRAKRAITVAEKEHRENLDRARDLSVLGAAIVSSFKQKNVLDREDVKKLEKVEKLAKGIRRAAGGSENDVEMEKPPTDLASAVCMLGEVSKSLKEKVEKTPKRVISAAVIDEANVLLELIRIVRTLPPKV